MKEKLERKIKSSLTNYADFKNILVPKINENKSPDESYTNKYQKQVALSYSYKLVCADDKFSKFFKSYLDQDAVYKFISWMIEESKYYEKIF